MEKGTVPKKGAHRDPDQQQDRPEARDEQPQQKTAVGRVVHSHVAGGPRPAQKHGSGHREKQRHRRPEPPMQPPTPHRPPVRRPLREAPDPHRSSLPHPPALANRDQTPLDPGNHMIRRTVPRTCLTILVESASAR
ncbi:hypothetical protein GCM10010249_15430 [Streptomyces roseolilacinus]|uniref:Uncharacterized protein n=1 Tax=Streptomyces roseolilacinus TaxID=66904 RepID=A0A918B123_9ACTN|nr:hypothetical protein GCM10010249_15430 [Streptomyces roseolilacinus]